MISTEVIRDYLSDLVTDPVPRFILFKEIYKLPSDSSVYRDTYEEVKRSKWYLQLLQEQWPDGSWGRFHSMDSKAEVKQVFPTTESALRRIRELSLDTQDPMVAACIHRMECYLDGSDQWSDRIEKHYGFEVSLNTMVAGNLSLFIPDHPLIMEKRRICAENMTKAFCKGDLDEKIWLDENKKSYEILLQAFMLHTAWLMQNNPYLNEEIQRKYLSYLWNRKEGIYYVSGSAPAITVPLESKKFTEWLSCLEALSNFTLFPEFMRQGAYEHLLNEAERLMNQKISLPPAHPVFGHYSESWRSKEKRSYDLLLRILRLLVKVS